MIHSAIGGVDERVDPVAERMRLALARYKDLLLKDANVDVSHEQLLEIDISIANLVFDTNSAEGQRAAFMSVKNMVVQATEYAIDPSRDLDARNTVRTDFRLPFFAQPSSEAPQAPRVVLPAKEEAERHLLDVEVVAIYW